MKLRTNNRLRRLRAASGRSKQDLAQRLGVHPRTILDWERGKLGIGDRERARLADFFGVSVVYLMGGDDTGVTERSPLTLVR